MRIAAYVVAHNNADWIEASILSLMDQPEIELVVVAEGGDGKSSHIGTAPAISTDGTSEKLARLADKFRGRRKSMVYLPVGRVGWKGDLRNRCLEEIDRRGPFDWLVQWGDDEVMREGAMTRFAREIASARPEIRCWSLKHYCFWLDCKRLLDYKHRKSGGGEIYPARITRHQPGQRFRGDHNNLYVHPQASTDSLAIYHYGYVGPLWRLVERRMWHVRDHGYVGRVAPEIIRVAVLKDLLCAGPYRIGQWLRPWPTGLNQPVRAREAPLYRKRAEELIPDDAIQEIRRVPVRVTGHMLLRGQWKLDQLDPKLDLIGGL